MLKNKYTVLIAAILCQIGNGGIYAWSTYGPILQEAHSYKAIHNSLIFGFRIVIYALSMLGAGFLLQKYKPKVIALVGAFFYILGYIGSTFCHSTFPLLFISIALFSGIGYGCMYICTFSTAITHFPARKGYISGIVTTAHSLGTVLISFCVHRLLTNGYTISQTLLIEGLSVGITYIICSFLLWYPETNEFKQEKIAPPNRQLVPLFLSMVAGGFGSLLVLSNIPSIALSFHFTSSTAVQALIIFSIGNTIGRFTWGLIYDKIEGKALSLYLFLLSFSLLSLSLSTSPLSFLVWAFFVGWNFGASLVVYAAHIATLFGTKSVGPLYPYIMLSCVITGSVGPSLGALSYDFFGTYVLGIYLASFVAFTGALFTIRYVSTSPKKAIS